MRHWMHWLAIAIFLGLAWSPARAAEGTPPAPRTGVLDPAGYFARDGETLEEITARIRRLEEEHGFRLYLVVEPALISTGPAELASQYLRHWLPAGNGLVVVYESDSRTIGIGQDVPRAERGPGGPATVPLNETSTILTDVRTALGAPESPAELATLVDALADRYDAYFARRSQQPPPARSWRMGMLLAGALAVLGLGAIALGGWVRHSSLAGGRRFRFPPSELPERLGAPAGAAVVSRRFKDPA